MSEPISWRGGENLGLKQLACKGEGGLQPFYMKVTVVSPCVWLLLPPLL